MAKRLVTVGATLATALLLTGCDPTLLATITDSPPSSEQTSARDDVTATVLRVVDGDTITVEPTGELPPTNESGTEHTVRILGIDTPERNSHSSDPAECGAEDATEYLTQLLDTAQDDVTLVYDSRADRIDRFGRTLAYVDLADGTDVGAELVNAGLASPWYPTGEPEPDRVPQYEATAQVAAEEQRGSWMTCDMLGRQ